ncbi:MAG: MoaD/ThiS family protein [Candidatus Pacebacteria bacterium]|nr:MoaD/ThiS family protein [Candidatus Paceibacterota bacterium]
MENEGVSMSSDKKGIIVSVEHLDKCLRDVCIEEGSTVADVFDVAGIDHGCGFMLNGSIVKIEDLVKSGDVVKIIPDVMVKIACLGDRVRSIFLKEGSTIGDALDIAGIDDVDEYDITCNGIECTLEDKAVNGTVITLIPNIEGGGW